MSDNIYYNYSEGVSHYFVCLHFYFFVFMPLKVTTTFLQCLSAEHTMALTKIFVCIATLWASSRCNFLPTPSIYSHNYSWMNLSGVHLLFFKLWHEWHWTWQFTINMDGWINKDLLKTNTENIVIMLLCLLLLFMLLGLCIRRINNTSLFHIMILCTM